MLQIVRGRLQNQNSARHGELQSFYYRQPSMQKLRHQITRFCSANWLLWSNLIQNKSKKNPTIIMSQFVRGRLQNQNSARHGELQKKITIANLQRKITSSNNTLLLCKLASMI